MGNLKTKKQHSEINFSKTKRITKVKDILGTFKFSKSTEELMKEIDENSDF